MFVIRAIALIPAYNSADVLPSTIAALRRLPEIEGILVVDDGSGDDTAGRARAAGVESCRRGPALRPRRRWGHERLEERQPER